MYTFDQALALDQVPGGLKSETLLAQAWIREHGAPYLAFEFNVAVGEGRDPGPSVYAPIRNAAIEASKRRIDVVAYLDRAVDLQEVKGRADTNALGQLVAYRLLWEREHPDLPVRGVGLICALIDPDLLLVANSHRVSVSVYPALIDAIRRT